MVKIRVEQEEFSSASGSDLNDEFDVDVFEDENVESVEDGYSVDSETESVDTEAASSSSKAKKQKKTFNPDALANAFQSVLRQNLPTEKLSVEDEEASSADESKEPVSAVPILAKSKAMDDLEEEQIDYRARKILKAQIRAAQESVHFPVANAPESLNFERSLRKLVTRGVVQLFNAIQVSQQQRDEEKRLRRQEKLIEAQRALPLVGKDDSIPSTSSKVPLSNVSSSASYFDFLKQQQQQKQQKTL